MTKQELETKLTELLAQRSAGKAPNACLPDDPDLAVWWDLTAKMDTIERKLRKFVPKPAWMQEALTKTDAQFEADMRVVEESEVI